MGRHSFAGAPALTHLTGSISPTDTNLPVASTTGWPDTAIGEFVIVIDGSEKVLCSSYTSTSVTATERGYDETAAISHDPGTDGQVFPCLDAAQFDAHDAFVWNNGSVTPTTSAIGDAAADGTSPWSAAADHQHGREDFASGITSTSMPGDSENDGTSDSPARADHKHAREPVFTPDFGASDSTLDGTTSLAYVDLSAGVGPAVSVVTGQSAIVMFQADMGSQQNVVDALALLAVDVSGSTTIAAPAGGSQAISISSLSPDVPTVSAVAFITGLTPGANTFTLKYGLKVTGSGSGAFYRNRSLVVIPLP